MTFPRTPIDHRPADLATLREIADNMKAVIEGKKPAEMVGPDYMPNKEKLSE